jgi:GalNAc-alpha-(1->4)-GalNAc-alpha-(1->3)-diNAcBac-PP-undecaprenol alpha-1,4-N-acetyl-D-galactosaminyltransferase
VRITLLISTLGSVGGSERSISLLANAWAQQGREVTLLTFDHGDVPAYSLHPSIRHRSLGLYAHSRHIFETLARTISRIAVLRRAIRESRPDIVVSFIPEPNIRTIVATRGLGIPVVVSERSHPMLDIGQTWDRLRRLAYPFADVLVCQTTSTLLEFQKTIRVRGRAIPNLIAVPSDFVRRQRSPDGGTAPRVLVAMGRLCPEKGFDLLLNAFARIAGRHPGWSLKIIGTGPLREQLAAQRKTLNLCGRVQFTGVLTEPFSELSQADLFVFSSRYEGFGNALCEAMACGLPAVSFNCPAGPGEIIRHEVDGILVPPEDVDALAAALDDLMTDAAKRERMALRAPEILTRFSTSRILSLWDDLFEDLNVLSGA